MIRDVSDTGEVKIFKGKMIGKDTYKTIKMSEQMIYISPIYPNTIFSFLFQLMNIFF